MLRIWRWLTRLVAITCISGLTAFSVRTQTPFELGGPRGAAVGVRDISGTWEGTFRLDSAWRLSERAAARSVPGRLHFDPVGDASPTTSSTRSVHPGTFEIDFTRFGFTLSTQEALGWSVSDDAMRATLNPTVDHGQVEVHGTFRGNTIVGTWRYTSDPGGATGTFEVARRSNR